MDRYSKLVTVLALAFVSATATAAYSNLPPPAGFANSAYQAAASDSGFQRFMYSAQGPRVPVGGGVTLPVAYKYADSAPSIAARYIFNNPVLAKIVPIAGWLSTAALIYDIGSGLWTAQESGENKVSDGYEYKTPYVDWHQDPSSACNATIPTFFSDPSDWSLKELAYTHSFASECIFSQKSNPSYLFRYVLTIRASSCPAGWFITPAGCSQNAANRPISIEDFVDKLNPANSPGWPMPAEVPKHIPIKLPVETPIINPDKKTGVNPFPTVKDIPTGNPVANPNFDSSKPVSESNSPFLQPVTRVTPSATPANPFQVDVKPVMKPVPSADPAPGPVDVPSGSDPSGQDQPPDLCEKHPDILACQKVTLGELDPKDLRDSQRNMAITPDQGWGPSTGTCPAPKTVHVLGIELSMPYTMLCDFASAIRPLFIAFAWLSAALTFFGLGRKD